MAFIEVPVKTAMIVHGFDNDNNEIIETVNEQAFVTKLIAVQRIQSISEDYILVTGSHDRVMYWQYDCTMEQLKSRLNQANLVIA